MQTERWARLDLHRLSVHGADSGTAMPRTHRTCGRAQHEPTLHVDNALEALGPSIRLQRGDQCAGSSVRHIVVTTGGMVHDVSASTTGTAFQADKLALQPVE